MNREPMYYRLNDNYALRGWNGLPYAISVYELHRGSGASPRLGYSAYKRPYFLNDEQFAVVRRFDGQTIIDETGLSEIQKITLRKAIETGVVETSKHPLPALTSFQKYKSYPSMYVQEAVWSITGRCNYSCRHCILSAPEGIHPELPLESCKHIIDSLAECGIHTVTLTGGEPLVRRDIMRIAEMLTERDIRISSVMTNGKLLTPQILDGFEKLGQFPEFQVSFDGIGYHDSMRGVRGAEQAALDAIHLLISRGFIVTVSMCIDRDSADSIRDTAKLLGETGVERLEVSTPQKLGAWEKAGSEQALTFDETMEIYLKYIPQYFEDGMPITLNLGGAFNCRRHGTKYRIPYVRKFDTDEKLGRHIICDSARFNMYISAEGQLMPCLGYSTAAYAERFPNILEVPLKDALNGSLASNMMTCRMREYFARNEECRTCEKRLKCAGGCRVNAMVGGRDNLSIDEDACRFHLGGYEDRIRETTDASIKRLGLVKNEEVIISRLFRKNDKQYMEETDYERFKAIIGGRYSSRRRTCGEARIRGN